MKALEESVRSVDMDGLVWGASKLVPVGYGVSKLQITAVVEDDKVGMDDLEEKIVEFEDYVQSSDIVSSPVAADDDFTLTLLKGRHVEAVICPVGSDPSVLSRSMSMSNEMKEHRGHPRSGLSLTCPSTNGITRPNP